MYFQIWPDSRLIFILPLVNQTVEQNMKLALVSEWFCCWDVGGHASHPLHFYLHRFAWRGSQICWCFCWYLHRFAWRCSQICWKKCCLVGVLNSCSWLVSPCLIFFFHRAWPGCWCTERRSTRSWSQRLKSRARSLKRRKRLMGRQPTLIGARRGSWRL